MVYEALEVSWGLRIVWLALYLALTIWHSSDFEHKIPHTREAVKDFALLRVIPTARKNSILLQTGTEAVKDFALFRVIPTARKNTNLHFCPGEYCVLVLFVQVLTERVYASRAMWPCHSCVGDSDAFVHQRQLCVSPNGSYASSQFCVGGLAVLPRTSKQLDSKNLSLGNQKAPCS